MKFSISEDANRMLRLMGLNEGVTNAQVIQMLKQQILKHKTELNGQTKFSVEVKDSAGNKKTAQVDLSNPNDPQIILEGINEDLKTTLAKVALVCTLAGGAMSCTKAPSNEFGYNINVKPLEYKVTPNGNKVLSVFTTSGNIKQVKVDSTSANPRSPYISDPTTLTRPLTKTEALIFKAGAEYEWEKKRNGDNGYNANMQVSDIQQQDITIVAKPAYAGEVNAVDPSQLDYWKDGIECLKKRGVDTNALLQKVEQEKNNKEWFTPDK